MSVDEQEQQPRPAEAPSDADGEALAAEEAGGPELDEAPREDLESRVELAQAEIERLQDQLLRRQAELMNYRRRVQQERAGLKAVAQAELLEDLLPVVDDFERAVDAEAEDARSYHEGMQLILRSVQGVLEKVGVERIEPRGEAFDPRFHEAIARQEVDDIPEGQVIDVYQTGYKLGDRLVRPATVVVAFQGGSGASAAADDGQAGETSPPEAAGEPDTDEPDA